MKYVKTLKIFTIKREIIHKVTPASFLICDSRGQDKIDVLRIEIFWHTHLKFTAD